MSKAARIRRFGDKDLGGLSLDGAKCNRCHHVSTTGMTCKAFRRAIPVEILTGEFDHRKEYPGDRGIRFEPREEE